MMIGSTIVFANDISQLTDITSDESKLQELPHVELKQMQTLDFTVLCKKYNISWTVGQPILYDEDNGVALLKINSDAANLVTSSSKIIDENPEFSDDVSMFSELVKKYGSENLYEMTSF